MKFSPSICATEQLERVIYPTLEVIPHGQVEYMATNDRGTHLVCKQCATKLAGTRGSTVQRLPEA
jgi:hypothetical protein